VYLASSFESHVQLVKDGESVDAKSILGVLLLAAAQGSAVVVRCDGADEEKACLAIGELIEGRFGEDA
jgi:phosphocarrier protein